LDRTAEHSRNAEADPRAPDPGARLFERALALDPRNIEALVGMAFVDTTMATDLLVDDRTALLSPAETNAIKALSLSPDHAQKIHQ
jgi:hypothetical protein